MYPAERQAEIIRMAHSQGGILSVTELSDALGVTAETVRRDLSVLERQGLIVREHGGASLVRNTPFELSLTMRQLDEADEKRRIAARVVAELPADGVVLLDSGSMALVIASLIPDKELIVVTNNLPAIPVLLEKRNLTVLALPGRVRNLTQGAVDELTRRRLETLNVDVAILGGNGLTPAHGLTTTIPDEADVKRAMLLAARRRVLAITASKIGRTSFCRFARVDELDVIVTDDRIDAGDIEAFATAGPELVVV